MTSSQKRANRRRKLAHFRKVTAMLDQKEIQRNGKDVISKADAKMEKNFPRFARGEQFQVKTWIRKELA